MTVISSTELRGFFDPITLGLHAPSDFASMNKYKDDISLRDSAIFIHELSHYLQFYGSIFGYSYLMAIRGWTVCMQMGINSMKGVKDLKYPASNWPIDIEKVFPTQKDKEFYTQAMLMNRYFNEELYGFTYTHFGKNRPILLDNNLVFTSMLYFELDDGYVLPFTGRTLLENYAVCQETQFLVSNIQREKTIKYFDNYYLNLSKDLQARYLGIAQWIGTFELTEIEPLLYFTLLNQPMEGFLERLGDYTLANNTKRILSNMSKLRKLKRPNINTEILNIFKEISDITGLHNPLDVLNKWRNLLKPSISNNSWVVDWVSSRIWDWFLDEPIRILKWPQEIKNLLKSIPLINIYFANKKRNEPVHILNSKEYSDEEKFVLLYNNMGYSENVYIINGLYSNSKIRCPYIWYDKPNLCESCKDCTGYLPNNICLNGCPVLEKHTDLFSIINY